MRREPANSTFFLYNTICSITIYETAGDADKILEGAKELAFQIRRMLDFYDPDSELGILNANHEVDVPVKISEELCLFISELLKFSDISDGCFDFTVGSVVRLWNITAHRPKVPSGDEIENAMKYTGAKYVSCDTETCTVTFHKEGMVLDAGGAGKGYAVGCVTAYLKKAGVRSGSVNFGGNLYLIGEKAVPQGSHLWKIGIQVPWTEVPQSMGTLELKDCATATSGGYDRYFSENGKIYHHLIDPRTGYPAEPSLDSITIVSPNALYTDLLSTACFVAGEEKAVEIINRADVDAGFVIVRKDGTIRVSENLKQYFKQN